MGASRRQVDPARVFERIAAARVCVAAGGRLRFLGACTSVHVCVRSRSAHAVYHYLCVPCASRTVFTRQQSVRTQEWPACACCLGPILAQGRWQGVRMRTVPTGAHASSVCTC